MARRLTTADLQAPQDPPVLVLELPLPVPPADPLDRHAQLERLVVTGRALSLADKLAHERVRHGGQRQQWWLANGVWRCTVCEPRPT